MSELGLWSAIANRFRFLLPRRFRAKHPVVAVVRLHGVIGAAIPLKPGLTIASCASALERAFSLRDAEAVAITINSPGGSAVQSHLIFKRIRALAAEKKIPVFVFAEDVAASGGYMIACAGDEIFADPSSIVGSIGVVSAGFGLDRLIERFGIERRVHTVGARKAMLDPFRPESAEDVERLKAIQARVHETFVSLVRERRGERLRGETSDLFSGNVWSGSEAVELGLIDGIADLRSAMRERFGEKVQLRVVAARTSLLARLVGRGEPIPQVRSLVDPTEVIAVLEERSAWARYGL
jgi:signal peptide peptidase SppA